MRPVGDVILFVRNLPYKISAEEIYDLFGKYGAIRQVRLGNAKDTRGTAFVIYEAREDARSACDHLSGFNLMGRYLIVTYWQPERAARKAKEAKERAEIEALRSR